MKYFFVSDHNHARRDLKKYAATHVLTVNLRNRKPYLEDLLPRQHWGHMVCDDVIDPNDALAPTNDQVKYWLNWFKSLPENACVLVHCEAGISRSTAMALAGMVDYHGVEKLDSCVEMLLTQRPSSSPNTLITEYADKHLNAEGRLLNKALELSERYMERLKKQYPFLKY